MSRNVIQMLSNLITFSDRMTNIFLYWISVLISYLSEDFIEDSNEIGKIKAFNFSDSEIVWTSTRVVQYSGMRILGLKIERGWV